MLEVIYVTRHGVSALPQYPLFFETLWLGRLFCFSPAVRFVLSFCLSVTTLAGQLVARQADTKGRESQG